MSAIMLTPGKLSIEHADIHSRHLLFVVIVRHAEILRAEQPKHRLCGNGSHIAALMIEPLRIAFFRNAVADERQPRCTQRDQFVSVYGDIARRSCFRTSPLRRRT
jgi:hypothetical protein